MHYLQLTLTDYSKTLVNLDKVEFIRPHELNNFRNATCTVISFGANFIEVLEPLDKIESMIQAQASGVNYHG